MNNMKYIYIYIHFVCNVYLYTIMASQLNGSEFRALGFNGSGSALLPLRKAAARSLSLPLSLSLSLSPSLSELL